MDGIRHSDRDEAAADQILDCAAALELVGGDREVMRDLLRLVEQSCTECLAAIHAASAKADAEMLRQAAHRLKGSLVSVAAGPAGAATARVEDIARQGDLTAAPAAIAALEQEVTRLRPVLRDLVEEP
jgi:HPt (histidine-containing phosphotransfer) domain-containing protein